MRKRFEQQHKLGIIPISEVQLPIKSRDELPPILRALQHIYVTPELNEEVFKILEGKVLKGKKKTGRYGMDLWHILVLSSVRLGLEANYDRLEDFANHHKLIRQILGVETTFGEGKRFSIQSIKDNVSLLDEEIIRQINEVVVSAGHRLVKKRGRTAYKGRYVCSGDRCTLSDRLEFVVGCGTQESGRDRGCNTRGASGGEGLAQGQILEERAKEADEDQHKGVIWRGKK